MRDKQRPIVVGPWISEVGFEVLYWIPYLRKLLAKVNGRRVYVITRGGASAWYGVEPGHEAELYDMRPVEEIRHQAQLGMARRQKLKQTVITDWDRSVTAQACETWGIRHPLVLHPSRMYLLFSQFFHMQEPIEFILQRTAWDPIPPPALPAGLPPRYYAVAFYIRATLSGHPRVVKQCSQMVHALAEHLPVVLLRNPHFLDDHLDLPVSGDRIFTPDPVDPHQTLALHGALIAHSVGVVGTYGGLLQLALRMGKPSIGVYEHLQGTSLAHLQLSEWIANRMGIPFYGLRLSDAPMLGRLLAKVTEPEPDRGSSS